MKKTLSIILSVVMLLSIFGMGSINAFAGNCYEYDLVFGVTQSGQMTDNDEYGCETSAYKFSLSTYTTLALDYDAVLSGNFYSLKIYIIKYEDYSNWKLGKYVNCYYDNTARTDNENSCLDDNISLYEGSYYLLITTESGNNGAWATGLIKYSFSLTPTVNQVNNLKATAGSDKVKLSWMGDLASQGYQIQKKTSNGYKTIKETTKTSYTVKDLSSATKYSFRVRGYVKVDGKKYYGEWKSVSAMIAPAKVSIKAPYTDNKHQIVAKWKSVSGASGYQVQYCKNNSFSKSTTTKNVSGQAKSTYVGKGFKKGKTYYVRVRAYKSFDGKTYYGSWSKVKSIKCK